MPDQVNVEEVKAKVHALIVQADKEGTLEEYTPRIVRQKVEEELALESGVLDANEYKVVVKDALTDALEQLDSLAIEPSPEKAEPKAKDTPPTKRKSPDSSNVDGTPAKKHKTSRTKAASNGKAKAEPKVPKRAAKSESKAKAKPESKAKAKKNVRSASLVDSSEDEGVQGESSTATKTKTRSPKKSQVKKKQTAVQSDEDEPMPDAEVKSLSGEQNETNETDKPAPPTSKEHAGEKSDSEMSVLIDEPPKRRQKNQKDTDSKASKPKRKAKSKDDDLSPNEQEIKRLKSFVTACGVRKMWAKELKDMGEREQISRIKQVLADLGMTGRLSLEKAKAIRAKRELAQELEDVQQFEKAVMNKPRPSRGKGKGKSEKEAGDVESAAEESAAEAVDVEEEESVAPPKKRNARASIMAFLGDQSDSE